MSGVAKVAATIGKELLARLQPPFEETLDALHHPLACTLRT
jgi:hypothetical protein